MDDITARLPADAARCDEPAKHGPKILNLPSRVKTLISNNNYWPRETDRQIGLEQSSGAPSQKKKKGPKLIWIKGRASGRARARSLCRDVCIHNDLKAQGRCFPGWMEVEVICITWPSGCQVEMLKKAQRAISFYEGDHACMWLYQITEWWWMIFFVVGVFIYENRNNLSISWSTGNEVTASQVWEYTTFLKSEISNKHSFVSVVCFVLSFYRVSIENEKKNESKLQVTHHKKSYFIKVMA